MSARKEEEEEEDRQLWVCGVSCSCAMQTTNAVLVRGFVCGADCCCRSCSCFLNMRVLRCTQVEIRDVSFKYPSRDKAALRNVSLSLKPGHIVALVGLSGSGKSTLVSLIERHYDPTSGRVRPAPSPPAGRLVLGARVI